jgi:hypothetical protein
MKAKIICSIFIALFSLLVLGVKGCETETKADVIQTFGSHDIKEKEDIIDIIPELKEYARKFDIIRYKNLIKLTTYDSLTFHEAVNKLKSETAMNKPVNISLYFRGILLESEGELKSECGVKKAVSFIGDELKPYTGIIFIRDGYWTAIEFDAVALFTSEGMYGDDRVLVSEYAYANEEVYKINNFISGYGLMSKLDEREGSGTIKGDGSTPYEIISEFDR